MLGWGGYWAWDPVENASLLPWLTATALHPLGDGAGTPRDAARLEPLARRRDVLPHDPRHVPHPVGRARLGARFTESAIGPWLLAFLGRRRSSASGSSPGGRPAAAPGRIDSPVSREAAFLANNLLFAALAFVVLLGTVFPLVRGAAGRQLSVGEPYFDRMTTPIGLALLFLMAVAPALPWRKASFCRRSSQWLLAGLAVVGVHGVWCSCWPVLPGVCAAPGLRYWWAHAVRRSVRSCGEASPLASGAAGSSRSRTPNGG